MINGYIRYLPVALAILLGGILSVYLYNNAKTSDLESAQQNFKDFALDRIMAIESRDNERTLNGHVITGANPPQNSVGILLCPCLPKRLLVFTR